MTAIDSPILFPPASPLAALGAAAPGRAVRPATIRTTGPVVTAAAAVLTCGLLPLLGWLWQWNAVRQRDGRGSPPVSEGDSLLLWIPLGVVALLAAELGWMLSQGLAAGQIHDALLGHGMLLRLDPHTRFIPLRLPSLWNGALLLAYGCYWGAVRSHVRRQMRLTGSTHLKTGLRFTWVAAAVVFGTAHLWWGIPMMLAGAQQRQYLSNTASLWRKSVPAQPAVCATSRCTAVLPRGAHFCPRCGTARGQEAGA